MDSDKLICDDKRSWDKKSWVSFSETEYEGDKPFSEPCLGGSPQHGSRRLIYVDERYRSIFGRSSKGNKKEQVEAKQREGEDALLRRHEREFLDLKHRHKMEMVTEHHRHTAEWDEKINRRILEATESGNYRDAVERVKLENRRDLERLEFKNRQASERAENSHRREREAMELFHRHYEEFEAEFDQTGNEDRHAARPKNKSFFRRLFLKSASAAGTG
ncbi:hypothetical protein FQN54_007040 [Arachnomyces sp. PD_36]|nr:hypothetical protein FQN54_007040 [Arachnomyces sp. PD_36]